MNSIPVNTGEKILHFPAVWHDPDLADAIFIVVQDGATALMSRDYILELLADVKSGDLKLEDYFDGILIKTDTMKIPLPCIVTWDPKKETALFKSSPRGSKYYEMQV